MATKTKFELKMGAATREAFGRALAELGHENPDIVVLDADLSKSTMTTYFAKEFPDRFFECGIAEVEHGGHRGAGWPMRARSRSSSSFSCFVMNKGFEQLRVCAAYPHLHREGGGHAQRHLDRRRRPLADEHRGDQPGLLAAGVHGALAGR